MNLKQRTTAEILKDAGLRIAILDKYSALIAECEALAEQLNKAGGNDIFIPHICPHSQNGTLSAWVQAFGKRHEVDAAISIADLIVIGETPCDWNDQCHQLHLNGLDVTITTPFEAQKFAEAA